MKKVLKIAAIALLAVLAVVLLYVGYVFGTYSRIEDNQALSVTQGSGGVQTAEADTEYKVLCWNIGFGAYEDDFGFFMDGGAESRAWSKERLIANIEAIGRTIADENPDISILQEVDFDSDRSYHVDEALALRTFEDLDAWTDSVFAVNYHSAYLFYPITQPHGASKSGLLTTSKLGIRSAVRRSLPVETGVTKILDLDRCYSISRVPTDNGKELVIFLLHMSAYGNSDAIREGQIRMLSQDMQKEYEAGNYVLCGGDFNHDLKASNDDNDDAADYESWAYPFPREELPEHLSFCIDQLSDTERNALWNSARNADMEYIPGETYTVTLDGFIISDNIECLQYENVNTGYSYSDHDPVYMKFKLLDN